MNKKKIIISILCISCLVVAIAGYLVETGTQDKKTVVTIAIPWNDMIQNPETNYYANWLEKKTGYDINFEYIEPGYEKEYLYTMMTSSENSIDAVFLSKDELFTMEEFHNYAGRGLVTDLSSFIGENSNLKHILSDYHEYGLCEKIKQDKAIYYMPNMDTARKSQNMQVLWINVSWLKELGLEVPRTTKELEEVLTAFLKKDPNRNGLQDELPLISCENDYSQQSYNYLLNAFIVNDPVHGRIYLDESEDIRFAPLEKSFREGIIYCSRLYEKGLLSGVSFDFTQKQMRELVNSPLNMVGAFTSQSISDVVYQNCPEVLARFIQVSPLEGPTGEKNAVWVNYEPHIGGYIPANSLHKDEAFAIMDLMLSEEASLISEYGEEGVDWKFSEKGDLSTYGSRAIITTINYLNDTVQNKHLAGIGPQVVKADYKNGVTWNGNHSLVEYIDARAVKSYEKYYQVPSDSSLLKLSGEKAKVYMEYTTGIDFKVLQFITGSLDPTSDEVWNQYIKEFEEITE